METSWLYTLLPPLFLFVIAFKFSSKRKLKLPPSPFPSLPIIGHLYLLKAPLYRTYHKLSTKLGPIFSLQLGNRFIVIVSSPNLVEECSLASSPYGDHWRNLRRFTTIEVFSTHRLNKFISTRQDEIRLLLQKLYKKSKHDFVRVELRNVLSELTFNNIMRMVAGKRYFGEGEDNEEAKSFRELTEEVLKLGGVSNPGDFFSFLRWIDYKGFEKTLARVTTKMDVFLQSLIDEHRHDKNTNTMIDHFLSLQESEPEYYSDMMIKANIMVSFQFFLLKLFNSGNKFDISKKDHYKGCAFVNTEHNQISVLPGAFGTCNYCRPTEWNKFS